MSRSGFRPTRRDALIACFSAACMLVWFQLNPAVQFINRSPASPRSLGNVNHDKDHPAHPPPHGLPPDHKPSPADDSIFVGNPPSFPPIHPPSAQRMPSTKVIGHSPGWTLFDNLYMHNGTLLIISNDPVSSFPERRLMTSTGQCPSWTLLHVHMAHS
jgi:hypothetical protein